MQVITGRKQIFGVKTASERLSALCLYVLRALRSQPLQSRSFPMRGKSEKSSLSFPLIKCVYAITVSKENSLSNGCRAERAKLYQGFAGILM